MNEERIKLGELEEGILWAEKSYKLSPFWDGSKKVTLSLGKPEKDEKPDYYYLLSIEKHPHSEDFSPYLVVEVYDRPIYTASRPFCSLISLWHNFLLVAEDFCFYYIDLLTLEAKRFPEDKDDDIAPFENFDKIEGYLFVSDEVDLYCFDDKCSLVWKSNEWIAYAGISICGYKDGVLDVYGADCGGLDGYYFRSKIDIATGKVISQDIWFYKPDEFSRHSAAAVKEGSM